MSTTIDERVVEMRFDNKQFEQNVQTSISTIEKLEKSLNLKGASKGLEDVNAAAKNCNMTPLSNEVETVKMRFSALEVMAVTALANITNSALNAGKNIVSALTIDPIKTGFQEYETQINAVQTILANTQHEGTNLQQVNRALDELNTYADKTIYNFTEMTRNIGTFTAAGVNLQTSVDSIKGIANLAAVSGSTSQQASTAMYQLSQALAAGKVQLMDWNSVVNAGMGGKVFQDALIRTSELLGTGAKQAIAANGSFRESLTKTGWLTTEVLTETLKQFAGAYDEADLIAQGFSESQAKEIAQMAKTAEEAATKVKTFTQLWDTLKESAQSGWTQTWEILIGDFGEAKDLLTEISDSIGGVISKTAEARNAVLSSGLSSGWKQLLDQGIADEAGYIEAIEEVARKNGDAFDKMVADSEDFTDALKKGLKEGVISSDTLTEAVYNLQDKMSGMSEEELKAAGYTSEMVEQIESLDSGLRNGSISMDEFTEKILRPSGRENLIQALWNAAQGLMSVVTPMKEAFREIFPPMTGDQVYNLTVGLQELTEKFKIGEETANNLKRTFKGVFALFDIGLQGVKALVGGFADLIGYVAPAGDGILGFTASIGDFIVGIDEAIKSSDAFNKAIEGIGNFLKPIADGVKTFVKTVVDAFGEFANVDTSGLDNFADKVQTRFEPFVKLGELVKKAFEGIIGIVEKAAPVLSKLGSIVANAFGNLGEAILTAFDTASFDPILDLINTGLFSAILIGVKKFIDSLSEITENGGGILGSFKDILDGVKGSLEAWQSNLKAGTLLKIAGAMAILTAAIVALSLVDSEKLNASLGALSVLFVELLGSMAIFEKIMNGAAIKGMGQLTIAMIGMSTAVLILAGAVQKLSGLDWDELLKGLVGVAGLSAILVASTTALSKTSKGLIKGSAGLVVFAAAIRVLVGAVEDLGELDAGSLAKGLIGVGVLCTELALFLRATDLDGMGVLKGTGLVLLAASINILADAVGAFGNLDVSKLIQGLSAVAVVLTELAVFTKVTANAKHVVSTATAMTILGAAMLVFGEAVEKMGNLSCGEIGRGLTTMAGSLAAVTVAMNLLPNGMISKATGMVEVGAALLIIGEAVRNMGGMSWDEIARGLVTLAGSMTILVVALNAMKTALPGAAAVLTVSAALAIFTPVLKSLGNMSWESIAKGLVALAGSFTVLGVAGVALGPLTPAILGLSAAIAVLGVGCLAAGAGILAFSTGLSALAVSGAAGAASLVVAVSSILSLIPLLFESIGEGILSLAGVIANGGPAIAEAFTVLVLAAVEALVTAVPAVVDGLFVLIDSVLSALVEHTPTIVEQLFDILIGIIQAITTKLPELIKAGVELLMAFFDGVIDALSGIDVNVLIKGIAGIGLLSAIMLALSAVASLVPGAMLGVLGMGAVIAELALVLAAVGALAQIPGLEWLIGEGGNLLQGIGTAIGKFVGGIVGGFMSGVSSQFPQIGADLSAFMTNVQPFIEGATQLNPSMLDGVKALAETILILTAADILNGLTSWLTGGSSLSDFATQLVPFGEAMRDFSIAIAGMDGELVANAATAGRTLAEMAATLPNSGGVIGFFTGENDMSAFGAQLIPFGEAMMGFANAVRGLDADTVTNAATAGKAMAEMATTIPNSGGVVGFFAGENDMDAFGEQLVPFGEAMMLFSQAVKGLDANVIVESATAGKALIELANTVPNSGGVVGFFTGENDMDTFGEKLVPFGRAMKSYSDAIAGIDVEAVTNSATAGKAVVELANTLPNTGGLVSWFTGDNDIASFGTSLVSFGKSFAQYSDYMKDVDANIVTTTTNAATSIVELQKSLPKEGGWFSDDMTLASFGSDMASFGAHFSNYYNSISGIDTTLLSGVITQTNRLVSMANGMVGLDTSGMTSFSSALTTLGETGVTGFINAFNNAESRVTAAASNMLSSFINGANAKKSELTTTFTTLVQAVLTAINGKQGEFQTSGSTLMVKFIAGVRSQDSPSRTTFTNIVSGCLTAIRNKYGEFTSTGTQTMVKLIAGVRSQDSSARMAFTNIISACLTVIKNKYAEFTSTGSECMVKFIAGVRSKDSELRTAFTTTLSGSITAIKDYYSQFKSAGSYLVDGFCDGISENTWKAEAKARAMAASAAEAAEDELDEHSPSKRFYGIGNFAGVGFINALIDNVSKAGKAGREIARSSIDGLNDVISRIADYVDADMDVQPTIRPVLDLSAVEAGTGRLNTLFSRNQALSVSTGMNDRVSEMEVQNGESSPTGNTYQFTQNNYSPKALSRIDIYRQTKNQFSAMKGLVGNT
jgi:hypothetical protein